MPYTNVSPTLHSPVLDSSQDITLIDVEQHSTRMKFYFHYQCICFIDYFSYLVPGGLVIYAGDAPFWHDKEEGTYTEFFGNPKGYVFLSASNDHEFIFGHRVSCKTVESRKSNHDCKQLLFQLNCLHTSATFGPKWPMTCHLHYQK